MRLYWNAARTLKEVLEEIRSNELKSLCRKAGLPKHLSKKAELVQAMMHYLDAHLGDFLHRLSPQERLLAAEAAHSNGEIARLVYEAKHGFDWPVRMDRYDLKTDSLVSAMGRIDLGGFQMPDDLAARVRAILPRPAEPAIRPVDALPPLYSPPRRYSWQQKEADRKIQVYEGEKTALPELRRVLQLVAANGVKIAEKSKRPTESGVKAISAALLSPDFEVNLPKELRSKYYTPAGAIRAHAWAVLVQQCGWCKPRGEKLVLTAEGAKLLRSPDHDVFAMGFGRFLSDDRFDEFNRIDHIRGQSGGAKRYMNCPSFRKEAICNSMACWPQGRWISFDEAFRFLLASRNAFEVIDEPFRLYFLEQRYGHLGDVGFELSLQYMRAFLFESLATLGVVDVAYVYPDGLWPELGDRWGTDDLAFCSRYDGLLYLRLNAWGAHCLGLTDAYAAPAAERQNLFKILPNREIVLMGSQEPSLADLSFLGQFALQKGEFVWELDAQRMVQYLDSGGSLEDVRRFLENYASNEIPDVVSLMFSEIAEKATAVQRLEEALLIEVKDLVMAAFIAHHPATRKYVRLSGDRLLVVSAKNRKSFKSAMLKLGYLLPLEK